MKTAKRIAFLLLGLTVALSGCSVPTPARLGGRMFVENTGVDSAGNGVVLSLNGFLPDLDDENAFLTQSGASISGAMEALALRTGRHPYLPHNGALIVGRDAARSGIDGILHFFSEYPECRGSVPLFVADTSAAAALDAIRSESELDNRALIDLVADDLHTGRTLYTPVYRAAAARASGCTDIAAPVLSVTDTGVAITGTAVFRGDALAMTLSSDETVGLQLITGSSPYALVHVSVRGAQAVAVVTVRNRTLTLTESGDGPRFTLRLTCIAELSEYDGAVTAPTDREFDTLLADGCAALLGDWVSLCAERLMRAALDPMGLIQLASRDPQWADAADDRSAFLRGADFSAEVAVRTVQGSAR